MKSNNNIGRRVVLKNSVIGILGLSLPFSGESSNRFGIIQDDIRPYPNFPYLEPELVSEVVGKSHFDLERVKELVETRPELARATWEWRFGDFETAIGAASHVGRRDIVQYLISKGASPNIFTFAMMGATDIIKRMIAFSPGIQTSLGPHGISLLSHAKVGLRMEDTMSAQEVENSNKLIAYLEELGDANGPQYLDISDEEREQFVGDYMYGKGEKDGFSIKLNMRRQPALGPIGEFGGGLLKIDENLFTYNGAPSVKVSFVWEGDLVKSLIVKTPDVKITALKI